MSSVGRTSWWGASTFSERRAEPRPAAGKSTPPPGPNSLQERWNIEHKHMQRMAVFLQLHTAQVRNKWFSVLCKAIENSIEWLSLWNFVQCVIYCTEIQKEADLYCVEKLLLVEIEQWKHVFFDWLFYHLSGTSIIWRKNKCFCPRWEVSRF